MVKAPNHKTTRRTVNKIENILPGKNRCGKEAEGEWRQKKKCLRAP